MRNILLAVVCLLTLAGGGCATSQPLVLAPVGPTINKTKLAASSPVGWLTVYSAFETVPAPADYENPHHSDYRLLADDGSVIKTVRNRSGGFGDEPVKLELPEGTFRVVAEANGYGNVTVPVVVVRNKTTVVHLEGGAPHLKGNGSDLADFVTLPDGQIVGMKATTTVSSR